MELKDRLTSVIEPVVNGLGYELVLLEYAPSRGTGTLRLYIDFLPDKAPADDSPEREVAAGVRAPEGIQIEDCERVSREVAATLDVEDPIPSAYRLEVSSPGLDRPLVKADHFRRFAGERVRIEMLVPIGGQKRFRGILRGTDAEGRNVMLETETAQQVSLPLADIERARVIPDYERELKNS
jgi:ribosome maturation factor RimP